MKDFLFRRVWDIWAAMPKSADARKERQVKFRPLVDSVLSVDPYHSTKSCTSRHKQESVLAEEDRQWKSLDITPTDPVQ